MKRFVSRSAAGAGMGIALALVALSAYVETQGRFEPPARGQGLLQQSASSGRELREWDARVIRMERDGLLKLRAERADTLVPGRSFARYDQLHRGVRVWGGEVVVERDRDLTVSVVATIYPGIDVAVEPALSAAAAKAIIEKLGGATLGPSRVPALVVLPLADGGSRLAYTERVATIGDVRRYFIDARTGARLDDYSEVKRQSAVGSGVGVLGDTKKISTRKSGGTYLAEDALRPPALKTFDLKGDPMRLMEWLNGVGYLYDADLASDSDNTWTDPDALDAHVHSGWSYDFFYKRFGRRGIDNINGRVLNIVHPVRRIDLESYVDNGHFDEVGDFYVNAFYMNGGGAGGGIFVFGEGLPHGWTAGGKRYDFLAGGLEIVGHEFTHGVNDYSCNPAYRGDPRALDEAFADMMGVSIDFSFRPATANYTIGEQVVTGGIRSLADPASFGDVDHLSRRKPAIDYEYENSTIASHAFYLAIEGGVNRTSGLRVDGVGAANREQVEKAFYRGFTSLPSQGTFALARARTIESAQVLYGASSAAARAIAQAWDAVGVK
jgi:Zn-dependent metalloprotease